MIQYCYKCDRFQRARLKASLILMFIAGLILLTYRKEVFSLTNVLGGGSFSSSPALNNRESTTKDVLLLPKRKGGEKANVLSHFKMESTTKSARDKRGIRKLRKKGKLIPFLLEGKERLYGKHKREECGTSWQENYIRLHQDILNSRKPTKIIIYLCGGKGYGCGGYGNRLYAISSLLLLAIVTDRAFLIDWNYSISLQDYLYPKNINWNFSVSNLRSLEYRRHFWGVGALKAKNEQIRRPVRDHSQFPNWIKTTDFRSYFDQPVEIVTAMWYFPEFLMQNPYLVGELTKRGLGSFRRLSWIGCAFDFLFTKSPDLETRLAEARKSIGIHRGIPVMGLHIRVGDKAFGKWSSKKNSIRMKNYMEIINCANASERALVEANPNMSRAHTRVIWFLASDDVQLKQDLARKFPAIRSLDIKVEHIAYFRRKKNLPSSEGMIGVLLDHFLLSESDFLVLSKSSFGTTAIGLRFHPQETYTFGEKCKY